MWRRIGVLSEKGPAAESKSEMESNFTLMTIGPGSEAHGALSTRRGRALWLAGICDAQAAQPNAPKIVGKSVSRFSSGNI